MLTTEGSHYHLLQRMGPIRSVGGVEYVRASRLDGRAPQRPRETLLLHPRAGSASENVSKDRPAKSWLITILFRDIASD
jgi:hypothetical protein